MDPGCCTNTIFGVGVIYACTAEDSLRLTAVMMSREIQEKCTPSLVMWTTR